MFNSSPAICDALLDKMMDLLPRHGRLALEEMVRLYPPLTKREVLAVYACGTALARQDTPPERVVMVLLAEIVKMIETRQTVTH